MKLYKITSTLAPTRFVTSLTEGVAHRKALADKGLKRADIKQEEVNVPTDKHGLVEFLNKVCA